MGELVLQLEGVSLNVAQDEFVGFLGRGEGKTTLVEVAAGGRKPGRCGLRAATWWVLGLAGVGFQRSSSVGVATPARKRAAARTRPCQGRPAKVASIARSAGQSTSR
jgi:energy-coupling factor transporter ATP-binding protein EcfA2